MYVTLNAALLMKTTSSAPREEHSVLYFMTLLGRKSVDC